MVVNGEYLPYDEGAFDVVICTETLSHDIEFWRTLQNMHRVLKKGGDLLLTVRGFGFGHNDSPADFYRFTKEAVEFWLVRLEYSEWLVTDDPQYSGALAWARK